ncbi:MAG: hypothetical protein U0Q15_19465 [Kineosporiaceae bacterium]
MSEIVSVMVRQPGLVVADIAPLLTDAGTVTESGRGLYLEGPDGHVWIDPADAVTEESWAENPFAALGIAPSECSFFSVVYRFAAVELMVRAVAALNARLEIVVDTDFGEVIPGAEFTVERHLRAVGRSCGD